MTARTQQLDPPLKLNRPIRRYALEQYLEKEKKSIYKHEFIDGQIIKMHRQKVHTILLLPI